MKLKIEMMDSMIWILFIIPLFILVFFLWGIGASIFTLLLVPVILVLKNEFLTRHFAWKPAYSVRIATFDEDHRKLFGLMLQMHKALRRMPGKDEAREVLRELKEYTETHFGREEAMMKKHGFPGFEAHRAQHEEMKRKIDELQQQFEEQSVAVSKKVLRYLQDWLVNHIQITDKQYSEFLNSRGER